MKAFDWLAKLSVRSWALLVGAALLLVALTSLLRPHTPNAVPPVPVVPEAVATSVATASAQATVVQQQHVQIHIKWPKHAASGSVQPTPDPSEQPEIVVDVLNTATTSVVAVASTASSASVQVTPTATTPSSFGVALTTMPGYAAADVRVASLPVAALHTTLGVDLLATLQAAAVGVSVGDRVYVEAGGYCSWSRTNLGLEAGVGLRL